MKTIGMNMRKKIITASILVGTVILSTLAIKVYSTWDPLPEGQTDITFVDEALYNAVIDNLESNKEISIIKSNSQARKIRLTNDDILKVTELYLGEGHMSITKGTNEDNNCLTEVEYTKIRNIQGLEKFTALQELYLYSNEIDNIEVLRDNATIELLNVNDNKLDNTDMEVISTMGALTKLGIGENNIQTLEAFSVYPYLSEKLTELTIKNSKLTNLNGIESLTNLETLYIYGNNIEDYSKLNTLVNLKKIDLSDTNITDVSVLNNLESLVELQIYANNIEDISGLTNNSSIETLNLNNTKLNNQDFAVLETMTNLKKLGVANLGLSNLEGITNLTNLTELTLTGNNLKNISGIEKLINLEKLYINQNEIENIQQISNLEKLKELNIEQNKISDVRILSNLNNLESIFAGYNNISTDLDKTNLTNLKISDFKEQIITTTIYGEPTEVLTVDIPSVFINELQNIEHNENEEENSKKVLATGCVISEDNSQINFQVYTAAILDNVNLTIESGDFIGSIFRVRGTSIQYFVDNTPNKELYIKPLEETNKRDERIDLDINSDNQINEQDLNLIKKWYEGNVGEITDEQIAKIIKVDLNLDTNVNLEDIDILEDYINRLSNVLVISETSSEIKTNQNIIAKLVTSSTELDVKDSNIFAQNGDYTFRFTDVDGQTKEILASVNNIDKQAPQYNEPIFNTKEATYAPVTVTITASENLINIYEDGSTQEAEENNEETNYVNNTGWKLQEDQKTIIKTYYSNTEKVEEVQLIDEAGNVTIVNIEVDNIRDIDTKEVNTFIMKKEDINGENYINGTWTNNNIFLKTNNGRFSINGQGSYTETIINEEGEYEIKVTVEDKNSVSENYTYFVKIDKSKPNVASLKFRENNDNGKFLLNNSSTNQNIYVSIENSDSDNLSGIKKTVYSINNGELTDISSILREEGTYNIRLITYDNAGNSSEQSYTLNIDR